MDNLLLFSVLTGIAVLLILILWLKIQAFLSLLIASIVVGLLAGMPPETILMSIKKGMGDTLGFVATVVGLGAIFGAILENSGGISSLAAYVINKTGNKFISYVLMGVSLLIAIPVFFDVAFIILVPVIYAFQKKTGKSLLLYGIPLLAGLAVAHSFIPPTPGPVAVADILNVNLGTVMLAGILTAIPCAILSGPVFAKFIAEKIFVTAPNQPDPEEKSTPPSPGAIAAIILFPIVLILLNSLINSTLMRDFAISSGIKSWMGMLGHPFSALILANLLAWYFLGIKRGYTKNQLLTISTNSLTPAGIIILITGAGGVFKQILTETGAGIMLAESMTDMGIPIIVFAFLVSAIMRIIQGSATIAMITSASMTAALLETANLIDFQKALLVISIASGATILSHVNDSGFWLVSKYFNISVGQTLQSWTIMTTIIAFVGLASVLFLNSFF
ncbi:MAG: GntP family permease [Cytophagaceae bacterium]